MIKCGDEMDCSIFPALGEYDSKLPYYVAGIGNESIKGMYRREKGLPFYQWVQTKSGQGIVRIGKKTYNLIENTGILILPNEPYELNLDSNFWNIDWIVIGGYGVKDFFEVQNIRETNLYKLSNATNLIYKLERILKISNNLQSLKWLDNSCAVYDFMVNIVKNINYPQNSLKAYPKLEGVYDFIEKHYDEVIMLENLSDIIGTSPQYFCKLFKEVTGYRVVEYINCVRIRKSKELMFRYGEMKITEIATNCGFEDSSYFCSVFRKLEGVTPGEFKKRYFD